MKFRNSIGLLVIMFFLCSIASAKGKYDLVTQKDIYTYTNFTATKSLSSLILIEVKDRRPPTERKGGLLDDQTIDEDWKRPVDLMITDLLTREMQRSGLIKLMSATPADADYRLLIEILSLYGGTKERQGGGSLKRWFVPRVAEGHATFRMHLFDKSGKELTNIDFTSSAEQEMGRMSNYHRGAIRNAGLAVRETIDQILEDLDARLQTRK